MNRTKVFNHIRNLYSSKSHGCDDLSVAMIRLCDIYIFEPLCIIFERCIENAVYLSSWKEANVVPIHKKGNHQCKTNYRPILLPPIFSKILEQLFDSIYDDLSNNKLLTPNKSGFRPGDSTINQLLFITHKIYCAFDDTPSKETRAVFLDW